MRSDIFNVDVDALLENYNNNFGRFICHYVSTSNSNRFINYPQQLFMGISQNDILMWNIKFQDTLLPTVILEEIKIFKKALDKNGT